MVSIPESSEQVGSEAEESSELCVVGGCSERAIRSVKRLTPCWNDPNCRNLVANDKRPGIGYAAKQSCRVEGHKAYIMYDCGLACDGQLMCALGKLHTRHFKLLLGNLRLQEPAKNK
eukprot:2586893-Pyramimonas_sp.AAC.1